MPINNPHGGEEQLLGVRGTLLGYVTLPLAARRSGERRHKAGHPLTCAYPARSLSEGILSGQSPPAQADLGFPWEPAQRDHHPEKGSV